MTNTSTNYSQYEPNTKYKSIFQISRDQLPFNYVHCAVNRSAIPFCHNDINQEENDLQEIEITTLLTIDTDIQICWRYT